MMKRYMGRVTSLILVVILVVGLFSPVSNAKELNDLKEDIVAPQENSNINTNDLEEIISDIDIETNDYDKQENHIIDEDIKKDESSLVHFDDMNSDDSESEDDLEFEDESVEQNEDINESTEADIVEISNKYAVSGSPINGNGTGGIYIDIYSKEFQDPNNRYNGNSYRTDGCTWFVAARTQQITKKWVGVHSSANWQGSFKNSVGYGYGTELRAPAILCYNGSSCHPWGHVAILEKIEGNTAYISEGGCAVAPASSGYTRIIVKNLSEVRLSACHTSYGKTYYQELGNCIYLGPSTPPKPGTASTLNINSTNLGIGDALTASWSGVANATNYKVSLQCTTNSAYNQTKNVIGTSTSFSLSKPGTYKVSVVASNSAGSGGTKTSGSCVVHSNFTVQYKDWNNSVISTQSIKYGGNSKAPTAPTREGYTFQGWSHDGKSIKANTTITASYKINSYSVKFVDYDGNTIGNIQHINHGSSATAPTNIPSKTGYVFSGWSSEEYKNVKKQLVIQAVYVWGNVNLPIVTQITSAARNNESTGYNIGIKMTNFPNNFTKGKIVTALKTADGKMVASETTSISLPSSKEYTGNVFVLYSGLATRVEVSMVGVADDETTGTPKSAVVSSAVDVGNKWSDWSANPAPSGNDIISESRTEYRYKDQKVIKATSKPATPAGYTYSSQASTGTYTGYGNWSGWLTYSVGSSALRNVESRTFYRFYAFHCNYCGTNDPLSGACSNCGRSGLVWHERWEAYSGYGYSGGYQPAWNGCSYKGRIWLDGNWAYFEYNGASNGGSGTTGQPYRTQWRYRDRQEYYNYTYWQTNFSAWSPTAVTASATRKVETRKAYRFKTNSTSIPCYNYKRYRYTNLNNGKVVYSYTSVYADSMDYPGQWEYNQSFTQLNKISDVDGGIGLYNGTGEDSWYKADVNSEGNITTFQTSKSLEDSIGTRQTVSGKLSSSLSGKKATLIVYKGANTDPTASQIEYIGQTTISSDGGYSFSFVPKEEPSLKTGDFVITLGLEGATNYSEIGKLLAPKQTFEVEFHDDDNQIFGDVITVKDGDSVTPPTAPEKIGYEFVGWDTGLSNVHDNMIIKPQYRKKSCTVVFANYENSDILVKRFDYGDALVCDKIPEQDGKIFSHWVDSSNKEVNTVTGDMVVKAAFNDRKYTVTYLDWNGNELTVQENISYKASAKPPTVTDSPNASQLKKEKNSDEVFYIWDSHGAELAVTRDMIISPIATYKNNAAKPVISTKKNSNGSVNVTISGNNIKYYVVKENEYPDVVIPKDYINAFDVGESSTIYAYSTGTKVNDSEVVSLKVEASTLIKEEVKDGLSIQPVTNTSQSDAANYRIISDLNKTISYTQCISKSAKVKVPNTVKVNGESYKVVSVAKNAFKGNKTAKKITVGKNVKIIEDYAFYKTKKLESVEFSGTINKIGKKAFYGSKKIKSITINGNKIKSIGKNAFKGIKKNCKIFILAKNKKQYNKVVKLIKKSGCKNIKYVYKKKK